MVVFCICRLPIREAILQAGFIQSWDSSKMIMRIMGKKAPLYFHGRGS
jgi:hypothetical protein